MIKCLVFIVNYKLIHNIVFGVQKVFERDQIQKHIMYQSMACIHRPVSIETINTPRTQHTYANAHVKKYWIEIYHSVA